MNLLRAIGVGSFAASLLIFSSFALSSPASGVANVPVHAVGDSVGFGVHTDLGSLAAPLIAQLRQLDASDPNITINDIALTGSFDLWTVTKVTAVSTDTYTISEEFATGLKVHFTLDITLAALPVAGQYTGTIDPVSGFCTFNPIPQAAKRVSAQLDVNYLQTASSSGKWNVSDFALREETTNQSVDLSATFSGRNLPNLQINFTACTQTVAYENHDYTVTANVDGLYRIAYSPALDIFDFPMADGENWWVNSTATLAGTVSGSINVQGIDPQSERAFFDAVNLVLTQGGFSVTGLSGFPIVLERITLMLGNVPYLSNGVLHDLPFPVNVHLRAKEMMKTLADGQFHTVFELSNANTVTSPYFACYYSPDHGFIVGCALTDASGAAIFEFKNVPPGQAEGGITSTKTGYTLGTQGSPLSDFFFKPPFLGLLLIAAAVIVVAALLVWRSRARARKLASQVTPPPPPPPGTL